MNDRVMFEWILRSGVGYHLSKRPDGTASVDVESREGDGPLYVASFEFGADGRLVGVRVYEGETD